MAGKKKYFTYVVGDARTIGRSHNISTKSTDGSQENPSIFITGKFFIKFCCTNVCTFADQTLSTRVYNLSRWIKFILFKHINSTRLLFFSGERLSCINLYCLGHLRPKRLLLFDRTELTTEYVVRLHIQKCQITSKECRSC